MQRSTRAHLYIGSSRSSRTSRFGIKLFFAISFKTKELWSARWKSSSKGSSFKDTQRLLYRKNKITTPNWMNITNKRRFFGDKNLRSNGSKEKGIQKFSTVP